MDIIASSEEAQPMPCEACNGTGMIFASTSSSSSFPRQVGSAGSRSSAIRGRRSSAPEGNAYSSSLRSSLSSLPYTQHAMGSSSSGPSHTSTNALSSTPVERHEQNAMAHASLDKDNTRHTAQEEGEKKMHHFYQQDIPEASAAMEIDQVDPRHSVQLVSTGTPAALERGQSDSSTPSFNNVYWAPRLPTTHAVSHMSRFQAQFQPQSNNPSSQSSTSSGTTAPLLTGASSIGLVTTISTHTSLSDSSGSRSATVRYPGSTGSNSNSRAGSSRPTLPPIKHLLDDIDDWPQARAPRASSIRSKERSPVYESISRTRTTTPEPAFNLQSSIRSPTLSHRSIFARPAVPHPGNPLSSANASFRVSNLSEQEHNAYEHDNMSNSSVPIPASASASITKPSSQQNVRDRDENPISFQANKRLRRTSSSPRDRLSALSLDTPSDVSNRLSRPSLAVAPGHTDKYHSYFANAQVNNIESNGLDSYIHGYDTSLDDERTHYNVGDATLIVTPSLESTRGAELEAAIHLAGIAASGANERPRGTDERIYVTTSAVPSMSGSHRHSLQEEHGAMQKNLRALRAMGSSSDQSSFGTAPSLATDISTVAESSQGIGGDPRFNRSPSDSLGLSADEFGDISPGTSNGIHQDAQQYQQQQQQYQISPNEPDENNNSNGTGKYFCTVCQKRFTRPSALAVHSHMHTGAKPFACQICDRSFSVNSNLRRHMKTHSREEIVAADQ